MTQAAGNLKSKKSKTGKGKANGKANGKEKGKAKRKANGKPPPLPCPYPGRATPDCQSRAKAKALYSFKTLEKLYTLLKL